MGATAKDGVSGPKRSLTSVLAIASAVVTLVGGVVGLAFLLRPGLQPQRAPDVGKAAITDVRVERGVTFGQFLRRLDQPRGTLGAAYLARPGVLVQFHVAVSGFAGKALPLRSQLIDDRTHDLVGTEQQGLSFTPTTNDEERDWFTWAPVPRTHSTYHLVVTVYQPDGKVPLRAFPTETFAGLAG